MTPRSATTTAPGLLLTGAEAREADARAVAAGGDWDALLRRAGAALARGVVTELRACTGGVYGREVLLVAGKGDNGGDAWVAAARLRALGVGCTVLAVHGVDVDTSAHSGRARARWLADGGRVVDGGGDDEAGRALGQRADVVVDAVLGTGISGAPRGEALVGVRVCLEARGPVVACDIPSGVDADSGAAPGATVRATRTVTFGAAKRGLVLHPGASHAGHVEVASLGPLWTVPTTRWRATGRNDGVLDRYRSSIDKTGRGSVLVVAGSQRYAGAAVLCSAAAVRAGAGLVTLATTAPREPVVTVEPGVMVVSLPALERDVDGGAGGPGPAAVDRVLDLVDGVDAVVLGPGCGHGPGTRALADALLDSGRPLVIDADGLNVFRDDPQGLRRPAGSAPLVLTPHHRELGRLVGVGGQEAFERRHVLVPALAGDVQATVVGKGPGTVVAHPTGDVAVVTSGGPALGTGGSGDVLAGMLGAAVAQAVASGGTGAGSEGREPRAGDRADAVVGAVHRHGLLGDRVGRATGGRATAQRLVDELPALLGRLAREEEP